MGLYELHAQDRFGHNESGAYGLDKVALAANDELGGPSLDSQVVVGIQTNRYRVGFFGLQQQPTNLSNFSHPYPSFLTTLKTTNLIPSLSWAYTAGAQYRK